MFNQPNTFTLLLGTIYILIGGGGGLMFVYMLTRTDVRKERQKLHFQVEQLKRTTFMVSPGKQIRDVLKQKRQFVVVAVSFGVS